MKKNEKIKKHNFSFKKESPSPTYSLRFVCVLNIGTEYYNFKFTDVEILGSLGIAQCVLIKTSKSSLFTNVPAYIKTTQFVDICESQILAVFVLHSYFKNAQLTCTYSLCLYFLQKEIDSKAAHKNAGEIGSRFKGSVSNQFYQHFTSIFFANILLPKKNQTPTAKAERKTAKEHFHTKKLSVKC